MKHLYKKIPKVDEILGDERVSKIIDETSRELVMETVREVLDSLRKKIGTLKDDIDEKEFEVETIVKKIEKLNEKKYEYKLRKVINATGTVIHTNLGRSLINKEIMEHVTNLTTSYSNLELDLETGKRGSRYSAVIDLIKRITGAEDALVVNNNAAAVVLALSCWGDGKEVITSRGELVEIGGSFRIPEVMEQSGAKLVAVGATNKTHVSDYENAINENTGALLKVHTSNFRIVGFTETVELEELVELGERMDIPVIEDLGSGVLIDLAKYGLHDEPTVMNSVNAGVDIITFSGDKLLGGPQAGIIIGNSKYIEQMKKHPLNRAFRIDKFTIATLEATLRLYLNEEEAIEKIPTLKLLTQNISEIENRANKFIEMVKLDTGINEKFELEIADDVSQVGGGSMPLERIPTKSVTVKAKSEEFKVSQLEKNLRELDVPVMGRIYKENYYLDFRTIFEDEIEILRDGFIKAVSEV